MLLKFLVLISIQMESDKLNCMNNKENYRKVIETIRDIREPKGWAAIQLWKFKSK